MTASDGCSVIYGASSFIGEGCAGNFHWLFCEPETDRPFFSTNLERRIALSLKLAPYTVVFFSRRVNEIDAVNVCFFHRGTQVLRCGSGMLALAHVLNSCYHSSSLIRAYSSIEQLYLYRNDRHGYYEFCAPILPISSQPISAKFQKIVNRPIKKISYVGSKNDYCIVEFEGLKSIASLVVNMQGLCRISSRALIATAPAPLSGYDYVMRYFAPQYGQPEDQATGSANAVLAPYWQKKLIKKKVRSLQLSETGGVFELNAGAVGHQRVGGQAKLYIKGDQRFSKRLLKGLLV